MSGSAPLVALPVLRWVVQAPPGLLRVAPREPERRARVPAGRRAQRTAREPRQPGLAGANSTLGSAAGIASQSTGGFSGGGAPFVGVGIPKEGTSIKVLNEQTSYNTWEFIYDPRIEQMKAAAGLQGGGTPGPWIGGRTELGRGRHRNWHGNLWVWIVGQFGIWIFAWFWLWLVVGQLRIRFVAKFGLRIVSFIRDSGQRHDYSDYVTAASVILCVSSVAGSS